MAKLVKSGKFKHSQSLTFLLEALLVPSTHAAPLPTPVEADGHVTQEPRRNLHSQ